MFRVALRSRLAAAPRPAAVPRAVAHVRFLATPVEPTTSAAVEPRAANAGEGVEDLLGPRFAEEESTAIFKTYRGPGFPNIPVSR